MGTDLAARAGGGGHAGGWGHARGEGRQGRLPRTPYNPPSRVCTLFPRGA